MLSILHFSKLQVFLVVILLAVSISGQELSDENNTTCEQRAKQILGALTVNKSTASVRFELEQGRRGDCIHKSWMDKMKEYGVKQTSFLIITSWKKQKLIFKIKGKATYLSDYDSGLIKKDLLKQIKLSGLDIELRNAVLEKLEKSFSGTPKNKVPYEFTISLYDEEALPISFMIT